jgi:hypothetical protein
MQHNPLRKIPPVPLDGYDPYSNETSQIAFDMFQLRGTTHESEVNSPPTSSQEQPNVLSQPVENKASKHIRTERITILMLVTLGVVAGVVNGLIIMANSSLGKLQAIIIFATSSNYVGSMVAFMTTTGLFVTMAGSLCKYVSNRAAGSVVLLRL